ncbi:hypothetical protein LZ30DRAFT_721871 [Colletotrichum cereale]|nr:hypothetical protein LZ30DRAFT_721871 [Colletotrichum cereale]
MHLYTLLAMYGNLYSLLLLAFRKRPFCCPGLFTKKASKMSSCISVLVSNLDRLVADATLLHADIACLGTRAGRAGPCYTTDADEQGRGGSRLSRQSSHRGRMTRRGERSRKLGGRDSGLLSSSNDGTPCYAQGLSIPVCAPQRKVPRPEHTQMTRLPSQNDQMAISLSRTVVIRPPLPRVFPTERRQLPSSQDSGSGAEEKESNKRHGKVQLGNGDAAGNELPGRAC